MVEPDGTHVYWYSQVGAAGELDRDDVEGTGPENYYVCSPAQLLEGEYEIFVANYLGSTGTRCTVALRAGAQVRTFTIVAGPPDRGATLAPVAVITYDGSALSIR